MIPNIFVSSTIYDLQYLRDAIRETIIDLGYNPVMSDYGDIGYLPAKSAEESCYATVRDCQLAIGIVGKRYGEKSKNGMSVTHNEFMTIRDRNIPIITIVDQEVLSYKRVYDANINNATTPEFPGMDAAPDTFSLIKSIMDSPINNGIITFTTASDARKNLKSQLAHLFHELLSNRFNPMNLHIQDVLSEVKTLRHELLKDKGNEPILYLYAMKWLLDDRVRGRDYTDLAKSVHGSIDVAVPVMLESASFDEFIEKSNFKVIVSNDDPDITKLKEDKIFVSCKIFTIPSYEMNSEDNSGILTVLLNNEILMNSDTKEYFDFLHQDLRKAITIKKI